MPVARVHRCLPRAGIDPIDDPVTAARTLAAAVHRPIRHETIALLLDAERRGVAIVIVADTDDPDALLEIVELLAAPTAHDGRVAAMVVATVRPDQRDGAASDVAIGDVERWMEASELADAHGVELIEWFVIAPADVTCPRDRLGEPPRW